MVSDINVADTFSTSDHSYITFNLNIGRDGDKSKRLLHEFWKVDWELVRAHLALVYFDECFLSSTMGEDAWTKFKKILNDMEYFYVIMYQPVAVGSYEL